MHKWIKLLRAHDGHAVGAVIEVPEAIARTFVAAGIAEDATAPVQKALDTVTSTEIDVKLKAMVGEIGKSIDAASEAIVKGRPSIGRVDPGESEVDRSLPMGGFQSGGHFAHCLVRGMTTTPEPEAQKALAHWTGLVQKASPTGMHEGSDAEGNILVPGQISDGIWERATGPNTIMSLIQPMPVSGNSMTVNALHEDSRVNGSRNGGLQHYWEGEADAYVASRPKFRKIEGKLKKLTLLAYATNELLEDARGLESWLNGKVPKEMDFGVSRALIGGTGVGMPKGIRISDGRISVAKESGQAAATIVRANVNKMHNRMHAAYRSRAIWMINQDCEPQLEELDTTSANSSVALMYNPPGAGSSEFARLKGKPVIPIEQCETLGTVGDIIFASWENYFAIVKAGLQSQVSIHVRFLYDETAFKWTLRMDGQPYEAAPVTPYKGSTTTSSFIELATRA